MKGRSSCMFVIAVTTVISLFLCVAVYIGLSAGSESKSPHSTVYAPSGPASSFSSRQSSQTLPEPRTLLSIDQTVDGIEPNGVITLNIVDISSRTVIHDWNAVKNDVDGIYMKATEGTTYIDPSFESYAKAAIDKQIPIGFYHYLWPRKDSRYAKQQADFFYREIRNFKYKFYPVLDIEKTNGQSKETIAENVKVFIDEFQKAADQKVMCYCSPNFANHYLTEKSLSKYPLWIANYDVNAPHKTIAWKTFDVWQYGVNISIHGVSGCIDGDIATNDIFLDRESAPKM